MSNTILWNNLPEEVTVTQSGSLSVNYSDVKGGWEGEGNIDKEPFFRNTETGNFHLMSITCGDSLDSPCIDTGNPSINDRLLDCKWGLGTTLSDMGAFAGGDMLPVRIGDHRRDPEVPKSLFLAQKFPNPFNPSTTIPLNIPGDPVHKQSVTLTIYELRGRRIARLLV